MSEPIAPAGQIYVCHACGKTSRGQYGTGGDPGWDESCMLNSALYDEKSLRKHNGRVREIVSAPTSAERGSEG